MQDHDNGWRFRGREQEAFDESAIRSYVEGKRLLITGAGGFIGSSLARSISHFSVKHLSLLDIAESGLHELALDLDQDPALTRDLIVGDICDAALLTDIFKRHNPQLVLHTAACKHVSLMEENPFAAARANVLGTQQVEAVGSESADAASLNPPISRLSNWIGETGRFLRWCGGLGSFRDEHLDKSGLFSAADTLTERVGDYA